MNKEEERDQLRRELTAKEKELYELRVELQQQLELAAKVQRTMLPEPVRQKSIEADTRYIPIQKVGGDYCQILFPNPNICYITMSDVTGHGIGAALLATRVSSEVRRYISEELAPHDILRELNRFIWNHFSNTGLFLSFIAARIDLNCYEITWSGAGHPNPLVVRQNGNKVIKLYSQNPWIGVLEHITDDKPKQSISLNPGDRLLFYTDGLTESADANRQSLNAACLDTIATNAMSVDLFNMADQILLQVAKYRPEPVKDDISLIVVKIK